ncbi:signal recognition particle protein [Magnetovibrio blakemorei]|uniref:Signal recognition particle protein n=1 Tax=Magnetovibrio blakemorei TaxID=28181 RepID=A0A1E5QBE7_9PROT|nr:signal recognition particle protein [Magnetovibrio blakemorei]OEJ69355.1 signal recognition particle protein [Magnetovibrio blakemorei]
MFEGLSNKLGDVFDKLTRRGALKASDVSEAMREVRIALLEADVALPVVKDFIAKVSEAAVGEQILRSVTPGQLVVKVVHDHLVEMLGAEPQPLRVHGNPPNAVLMVGLQGSGKTTTTAKIAARLTRLDKKKVLMASLDIYRPAAQQQLAQLGQQNDIATLPIVFGEQPVAIAKRAMNVGRTEGYDVVMLDTAGRLHIDEALMSEVQQVSDAVNPGETLLVTDAMTGQDAVNVAKEFHDKVGITGIVLTRVDGDARGGAALSMRAVTNTPIKFLGVGEKIDELDAFDAKRVAGSILGQGDVVGLVERAAQVIDQEEAEKTAERMMKGQFTLDDMANQIGQLRKMGDLKGLMGMMPGMGKMKKQLANADIDEKKIAHQEAIIRSMTLRERRNPKLINGSRRKRIAAGSGTTVPEVNRLLKQFETMSKMMKNMGKMGKKGLLKMPNIPGMGGGAMPNLPPGFK